jgi:hypothetical protein
MTLGLNFYVLASLLSDEISHIGERRISNFVSILFYLWFIFVFRYNTHKLARTHSKSVHI